MRASHIQIYSLLLMSSCSELQVIVLEDKLEYIRGLPPGKAEQMDRSHLSL